jgi:hypothetical protein
MIWETRFASARSRGVIADLIDHENAGPQVSAELVRQTAGGFGGSEAADHVVEAREVD